MANAACDINHSYPNNHKQRTNTPYKKNAVFSNFQACGECSNICAIMVKVLVYWEEEGVVSRYESHRLKQKGLDCVNMNLILCLSKGSFCHLLYCQILNFRSPQLLVSLRADMKEAT